MSSSDSAFDLNLSAEVAKAKGVHSVTLLLDMTKCYDVIKLSGLFQIVRDVAFPLRLGWMLIHSYMATRRIDAFGSLSKSFVGFVRSCQLLLSSFWLACRFGGFRLSFLSFV